MILSEVEVRVQRKYVVFFGTNICAAIIIVVSLTFTAYQLGTFIKANKKYKLTLEYNTYLHRWLIPWQPRPRRFWRDIDVQ